MSSGLALVTVNPHVGEETDPCGALSATDVKMRLLEDLTLELTFAVGSFCRRRCCLLRCRDGRPQNAVLR